MPIRAAQIHLWTVFVLLCPTSFAQDAASPFQVCSIIGFPPVSSEAQVEELENFESLDFFVGPSMHSNSAVMACAENKEKLLQALASYKIQPRVLVEDMSIIARSRDYFADIPLGTMDWDNYHGLENIYTWLDKVVQTYPELISMEVIGTTYENREIRAYKIEKKGGSSPLKATYLECLIHPREWTISGVCTFIINELTQNSGKYTYLLDAIRFYIVPVVNPDGYAYTNGTGKDRWRKNRRPIAGAENVTCTVPGEETIGVDVNRNWPFQWRPIPNKCSSLYSGEEGVLEAEIAATTKFLLSHKDVDTFVDIHSYSQLVMFPWGYMKNRTENYDGLIALAKAAAAAAEKVNGTKFKPGPLSELIGRSNGGSMDWAYGVGKIPFTFALEMRPTRDEIKEGNYGYEYRVPVDQILPVCKEAWTIVQVLASKTAVSQAHSKHWSKAKNLDILAISVFTIFINLID